MEGWWWRREGGAEESGRVGGSEIVGKLAAGWVRDPLSGLAGWVRERDGFVGMIKKKKKRTKKRNERPDQYMYKVFSEEIGFVTIVCL